MADTRLPDATQQNPACGVCGSETHHDFDAFICDDCQLTFDEFTLEASFLDPTAETCGKPCDNGWHRPGRIKPGLEFDCRTCQLPAGHESLCWRGCRPRKAEK